jgi:imidazolonepropionase-like amidohydrolase
MLAAKQVGVAAGPSLLQMIDQRQVNLPQTLANYQIPFGFQSQATTGVQTLPLAVQYAVSKGLSREDALRALTAIPARFLALDANIGMLGTGRDADLVVLSGPPFELSTRVLAVMIDGQWVYEEEGQR